MSGSADAEQHLHDPPPPAGHYLDRWGFICEGQSAPPLSKEEAALEARCGQVSSASPRAAQPRKYTLF
jgi:hypothetical protein